MSRIAVVGNADDWSTEEVAQALRKQGVEVYLVPPIEWSLTFPGDKALVAGKPPPQVDVWLVKDLGYGQSAGVALMLEMLRSFEASGAKIVPSVRAMENCVDRYRRTVQLGRAGVPIIETRFAGSLDDAVSFVEYVETAVYKPRHNTSGAGLSLLKAGDPALRTALQQIAKHEGFPFYLQQFIPGLDRDLRVVIVGDEILGAYARLALPGKWQTSPRFGGRYAACPLTPELSHLAREAASACEIEFATVEFAPTPDGLLVYDVNPFASFVGLQEACGVHAGQVLARHCLSVCG